MCIDIEIHWQLWQGIGGVRAVTERMRMSSRECLINAGVITLVRWSKDRAIAEACWDMVFITHLREKDSY